MADFKPELSKKNPYWISKHRYYELKHFCLQYPEWERAYRMLDQTPEIGNIIFYQEQVEWRDYTGDTGTEKTYLKRKMELVEYTAKVCDCQIGDYIFLAVTQGWSFNKLMTVKNIPCGKDFFYDRRRKFFYLLSKSQ